MEELTKKNVQENTNANLQDDLMGQELRRREEMITQRILERERSEWLNQSFTDDAEEEWLDILASQKEGMLLKGVIVGVKRINQSYAAIVQYGSYQVLIPVEYLVEVPGASQQELEQYAFKRIGAEVDFVVLKSDRDAKLVVGNRIAAMKRVRAQYYYRKRNDQYLLSPGLIVKARVVAVNYGSVILDIFGKEVIIPISEVSYVRVFDLTLMYNVGDEVSVKLLTINRLFQGSDDVEVTASIKQTKENPKVQAIKHITEGTVYAGKVTHMNEKGIWVLLGNGDMDCLCQFPSSGIRPVVGSKVMVRIAGKDEEMSQVWGHITQVSRKRNW